RIFNRRTTNHQIPNHGHPWIQNLQENTTVMLEPKWPAFDAARARRVTEAQPRYVRNRYAKDQPKRVEVGHTVMGAQHLAGEVTRQLSDRDFRKGAGQPSPRKYPQ
ncbi:hypothetical protein, partial [Bradyrhizobium sp. RT5a]|uniref:hypothetical protein n=1 Tax=unclassified Bradyrhizobium TaxID=2631580 RepID=UPI003395C4A9